MSTEGEEERLARWERWALEDAAKHRRRMRWWRHMREYVSMKRLFVNGLVADRPLPDHPPWSPPSNWWPRYRWNRQG